MNALKNLLTGRDNETHDLGRWSWAICLAAVIGSAASNAIQGSIIGLTDLANALGAVVLAHGGALMLKKDTEPPSPDAPTAPKVASNSKEPL